MRIFVQTREIFVADFGDLISRSDDPARLVRLMIAEIEEAILEAHRDGTRLKSERAAAERRAAQLERDREGWSEKAELALSRGREDLAKGALGEREKAADAIDAVKREIEALTIAIEEHGESGARLDARLDEARARQKAILAEVAPGRLVAGDRGAHGAARVERALDRADALERRVGFAEARHGLSTGDRAARDLDKELAEVDRAARVEAAFADLKAKA